MAQISSAELKLYVWTGDSTQRPVTPRYTLNKVRPTHSTAIVFEVAELIKDYVKVKFDGNYDAIEQSAWVQWDIKRTYDDASTTDETSDLHMAFRGYGELSDGVNPELSKDLMISNNIIHNLCGDTLTVPFFVSPVNGVTRVEYFQDTTSIITQATGTFTPFTIAQGVRLNPPLPAITVDKTGTMVGNSNKVVSTGGIPSNATKFTYKTADGKERTVIIKCIDECKNTPHKISFTNKNGVIQDMWFFALKRDSMNAAREDYKASTINVTGPANYLESDHQTRYLENQGKERFTMNTGFISEAYNQVLKELLVSEFVYIHDRFRQSPSNPAFSLAVPTKVVTGSVRLLRSKEDKLINYAIDFEADSDFVQSIR